MCPLLPAKRADTRGSALRYERRIMTTIQIKIPVLIDLIFVWPILLYRLFKFGYTFRKIPLGEGKFTIVDPLIFYRLNKFHWFIDGNDKKFYVVRTILLTNGKRKYSRLHRELMQPKGNLLVDHKNGNTFDNRLDNLRLATHQQNSYNRSKTKSKTSSRFIGVHLEKNTNQWKVQINHQGKTIFIGRYDSEIEAARAYDRAALKYHGEFARLNFPREDYISETGPAGSKCSNACDHV